MKKIITVIIALLLIFPSTMNIHAEESEFVIDENNTLVKYKGSSSKVTIPEGVVQIGTGAFYKNKTLKEVYFPTSLKVVGENAFSHCSNINKVYMNDGLLEIMDRAFFICESIENVRIPDSVESIKTSAFWRCSSLETVQLSKNLKYMESTVFAQCEKLTEITIPAHIESFGALVFNETSLKNIYFEDGITKIPTNLFNSIPTLKQINIPDTITVIDDYAFANCDILKQIVLPDKLEYIGEGAFARNENLKKVMIPKSVTFIDKTAFDESPNVTVSVMKGSYAETFCKENKVKYILSETPDAPTDVKAYRKNSKTVSVSWKKDIKADKYQVFVASEKNSDFKLVKTTNSTSAQIKVLPGVKYAVKVRAVAKFEGKNHVSDFSDIVNIEGVASPVGFKVEQKNYNSLKLQWKAVDGATRYQVYRSTSKDSGFKKIKTTTITSIVDEGLETGSRYYYKVRAYSKTDDGISFSQFSKVDHEKPILKKTSITVKASNSTVKIAWKGIAGVEKYQVYRSTSPTGKYTLVKTLSSKPRSWTDKFLKEKHYYYKVRGYRTVGSKKVFSSFSAIKEVKIK